jgi:hypothetical protein
MNVVLGLLSVGVSVVLAKPIDCRSRRWTGRATASLGEIKRTLDHLPRADIVQIAWGEMLRADPKRSMAMPLLQYLAGTEPRPALRGYYRVLGMGVTNGRMPAEALRTWPVRGPSTRSKLGLAELCRLHRRASAE